MKYGQPLNPSSDCTPSAGTTGRILPSASKPGDDDSLSSATTAATRLSTACTYDTAGAPSEWPTIASRVCRPGVTDRRSGDRSNNRHSGLNDVTSAEPACLF